MNLRARKLSKKHGLKFTLEESPAESAARRLAKTDLVYFREEAGPVVKGDSEDVCYYTNSVHLSADAPVSLVERIRKQAMFHAMIESGAITHAFIGEERPSADAIARLITEAFHRTQSAQITISPEFTYCNACNHIMNGLPARCRKCDSEDVVGETRVVGYFSKIHNWNKSKRFGELVARQRGRYGIEPVGSETPGSVDPAPVLTET
jgi:ribonucleoside-triphosphate reductase